MINPTSLRAYRQLRDNAELQRMQAKVLRVFERSPRAHLTRHEIARRAGLTLCCVCGRVNSLVNAGWLKVSDNWVQIGPRGRARELISLPWVKS